MKTITYEQFLEFDPCYLYDPEKKALMESIAQRQEHWSAMDILEMENIPAEDRLWAVLREELIDAPILHEFACRCAERALSRIENPDPRSLRAIEVKRTWLRGEATDEELAAAQDAARAARHATWAAAEAAALDFAEAAAAEAAALDSAEAAAWAAARYAAMSAAREAAMSAAREAAQAAAWRAVLAAAKDAENQWQIKELQKMLNEQEG